MRRALLSGLCLCVLALPAQAEPNYDMNPARCGSELSDSSLRLTPTSFEFHESSCLVVEHKIVSQTASDLTLDCAGEGERWPREIRVEVTETGLRLTDESGTYDYVSCP